MKWLKRYSLACLAIALCANQVHANELSAVKKATNSKEYESLKEAYRACVLTKGKQFILVNSIDSTIKHAPIACKRELLLVRQFLLSSAFKVDVIDQLMASVDEGVEIDLVNEVYGHVLKKRGFN